MEEKLNTSGLLLRSALVFKTVMWLSFLCSDFIMKLLKYYLSKKGILLPNLYNIPIHIHAAYYIQILWCINSMSIQILLLIENKYQTPCSNSCSFLIRLVNKNEVTFINWSQAKSQSTHSEPLILASTFIKVRYLPISKS